MHEDEERILVELEQIEEKEKEIIENELKILVEIILEIGFINQEFIKKKILPELKNWVLMLILFQKQLRLHLIEPVILHVLIVMLDILPHGVRI